MRPLPNRCCRHFVKPVPLIQRPVFKPDVSRLPISTDLVPLAQMRDQTLLHMVPYMAHCFAAIAIMKVADPAANGGIDFIHYPVKRKEGKEGGQIFNLYISKYLKINGDGSNYNCPTSR